MFRDHSLNAPKFNYNNLTNYLKTNINKHITCIGTATLSNILAKKITYWLFLYLECNFLFIRGFKCLLLGFEYGIAANMLSLALFYAHGVCFMSFVCSFLNLICKNIFMNCSMLFFKILFKVFNSVFHLPVSCHNIIKFAHFI